MANKLVVISKLLISLIVGGLLNITGKKHTETNVILELVAMWLDCHNTSGHLGLSCT